uniref:Protein kinase domain-containing protein n=1 Tax=viral metagenome TaxID=1070528 RepID=A0A6C0H5A2_9ZZZZ
MYSTYYKYGNPKIKKRSIPEKIGEGTYGCIYKPSLECVNNEYNILDYDNLVGKYGDLESNKEELKSTELIEKIDPKNEFHLPTPILCKPKTSGIDFHTCDVKVNNGSLLVMHNGGYDLSNFCKNYLMTWLKTNKISIFLKEFSKLFYGLIVFKKKGIIHYDLKPQNILFNPEKNRIVYIDFGLMTKKNSIINDGKMGYEGSFHWSYPLDNYYLNKKHYDEFMGESMENKKMYADVFLKKINGQEIKDKMIDDKLKIHHPRAFVSFFKDINYGNNLLKIEKTDIDIFFNTLINYRGTYDEFADKTVDTIDIYGLGMTLQFVINILFDKGIIKKELFNELTILSYSMYNFNFEERMDNPELLYKMYNKIIKKYV